MSDISAASITVTLSGYDLLIRKALEDGDLQRVNENEQQIVSFKILIISRYLLLFKEKLL
jgi:hypothetical protein